MVHAFRKARVALVLPVLIFAIQRGVNHLSNHFSSRVGAHSVWHGFSVKSIALMEGYSFVMIFVGIGVAAVFLRMVRTGEARWKEMLFCRNVPFWTVVGIFILEHIITWIISGPSMLMAWWCAQGSLPVFGNPSTGWWTSISVATGVIYHLINAFLLFPLLYLIVDEPFRNPFAFFQKSWELTQKNKKLVGEFALLQILIMALTPLALYLVSELLRSSSFFFVWQIGIGSIYPIWGLFLPFLQVVLYERLRAGEEGT